MKEAIVGGEKRLADKWVKKTQPFENLIKFLQLEFPTCGSFCLRPPQELVLVARGSCSLCAELQFRIEFIRASNHW